MKSGLRTLLHLTLNGTSPTHLSVCPSIHPSVCPSVHPSIHPSIHPSDHPFTLQYIALTCSTHTLNLIKRIPSDNVSGTITFTVGVTKDHPDIPNSQTQAGSFSPSFGEDLVVPLSSPSGAQFQPTFTSNDRDVCFVSDQEIPPELLPQ